MFHVGILIHRQCVHLIWVSGTGRLHRILNSELETSRLPNLCLASEAKQEHKSARRLFRCTGLDGFWTSLRGNLLENRHKHWFWTCHAMSCKTNSMWYDMYIYYICIYIYIFFPLPTYKYVRSKGWRSWGFSASFRYRWNSMITIWSYVWNKCWSSPGWTPCSKASTLQEIFIPMICNGGNLLLAS